MSLFGPNASLDGPTQGSDQSHSRSQTDTDIHKILIKMAARSLRKFIGAPVNITRNVRSDKTPSPSAAPLPLTFGVELEMLLTVKKNLDGEDSWLQTGDFDNNRGRGARSRNMERRLFENDSDFDTGRVYTARILDRADYPTELASGDQAIDVSKWNIKSDLTVDPDSMMELRNKLPDRVVDVRDWKLPTSIELVSRVLPVPTKLGALSSDPSLFEVEGYMRALLGKSNDPYGVYANETCGLHVHIGQDPRRSHDGTAALPLDVLQHLSFMLIQFESLISNLHPPSRRVLAFAPAVHVLGSNRMAFRPSRHVCSLGGPVELMDQIESKIFATDMTMNRLVALMSETLTNSDIQFRRYKYVNYTRLLRRHDIAKSLDKTIEFRQHAGTVKPEHISQWILFVTSLVRAAERKAAQTKPATPANPLTPRTALQIYQELSFPRQQGNKYHLKCQSQYDEFERLFDLLEFDNQAREYWLGRYARFNPDDVDALLAGEPQKEVDQSKCNICYNELSPTTREAQWNENERLRLIWDIEDDDDDVLTQ